MTTAMTVTITAFKYSAGLMICLIDFLPRLSRHPAGGIVSADRRRTPLRALSVESRLAMARPERSGADRDYQAQGRGRVRAELTATDSRAPAGQGSRSDQGEPSKAIGNL